jgi:ABC-type glycerol-3-phosphate transport system permease component
MATATYTSSSRTSGMAFQQRAAKIAIYVLLILAAIIFLAPMLVMLMNSFKSDAEMYVNPVGLPIEWTLVSYQRLFGYEGQQLIRNYANSVVIAGTSTILAVLFCAMAGFAFSKYRFRGDAVLFALLLATMMVPPEITMPGLYIVMARFGWINTLQAQILPTITPILGLFLIRQYMLTIPSAVLESARIDGAGHWSVFWRIMVPMSAPVLGAYAILHFMSVWNAYTWPVLVATRQAVQPIMVVLPQLVDPHIGFLPVWGTIMAGCVLSTIPLLVVFIAFQDKFMSSMTIGAVKG